MNRRLFRKSPLAKKARGKFRGYPLGTVAYYGSDNQVATKVAVGVIRVEGGDVDLMERWFFRDIDVRIDPQINQEVVDFLDTQQVRSVVVSDRIIGCPHEEGIDYPEGQTCSQCPYWENRDRWTG
jgi:hypothetical protein